MIKLKKLLFLTVSVFVASALIYKVYAANGEGTGSQGSTGQGTQGSTTQPIQNQNQVQTQNQGEDQQLQIQTQEQEQTGTDEGKGINSQNRNQNAVEHMSEVAKKVQELQQIREEGGLGEQVRQIAQEQSIAQSVIKQNVDKLNSRGALKKLLLGTDYSAIKTLKAQLAMNQLRITQLEQIQTQLINQEDVVMVQATIQSLIEQNTALQNQINTEEKTKSMFGWMFKFFAR